VSEFNADVLRVKFGLDRFELEIFLNLGRESGLFILLHVRDYHAVCHLDWNAELCKSRDFVTVNGFSELTE